MAPLRRTLTKLVVERTDPDPTRDLFVWDSKVPGFGVRIYPAGSRCTYSSTGQRHDSSAG